MAKRIDYASLFTLRKDGRYQGSYTDDTGRHYVYDRDPKRLWERIERKKAKEEKTFKDVAEEWAENHRLSVGTRTWANYLPHFQDILETYGDKAVSELTPVEISTDLQRAKAKGYSVTIIRTRLAIFNGVLGHAAIKGHITFNPALMVKMPKNLPRQKRRAPSDEEIAVICSNIDAPFGFFPFFLLCTGMRKSEALALKRDDIDLLKQEITVNKALEYPTSSVPVVKAPKTESGNRVVPIIDVLVEPLKAHLDKDDSEYVFHGQTGYMPKRSYDFHWRRYCETVGFIDADGKQTVTAHMLRHGTATLMFESGVDMYTAQAVLGHANVSTTMGIYTELRENQRRKSVGKFNKEMSKMMSKT